MDEVVIRGEKDRDRSSAGGFFLGWAAAQSFLKDAGPLGQYLGVVFGIPGPGGGSNFSWLDPDSQGKDGRPQTTGRGGSLGHSGNESSRTLDRLDPGDPYSARSPTTPVEEVYVFGSPPDRRGDQFWWLTPTNPVSGQEIQLDVGRPPSKPPTPVKPPTAPTRGPRQVTQPEPSAENDEDIPTVYVSGQRPERDGHNVYAPGVRPYRTSRDFSPFNSDVAPPADLLDWNWDAQRPERRAPVREERAAFTETEWVFPTTRHSPIPMITEMDTGSSALNFVMNKLLLPWRNLLAAIENTPFEMAGALDDAMRKSPFSAEWEASQSMTPLFPAMGLTMETTGTLTYFRGLLSTIGRELADTSRMFAIGFVTTGGIGGFAPGGTVKTMVSVDPPGFRRSGNAYKRILGVERTLVELLEEDPNYVSLGREMGFEVRRLDDPFMEPVRVRFDELFVTPDGYLLNAESKFGQYAGLTRNEAKAGYSQEVALIAVPSDATALRAGLAPGQPVLIFTRVFRWMWGL